MHLLSLFRLTAINCRTLAICYSLVMLTPAPALAAASSAQVIEGGGYRLQLQDCQRQPGLMHRILCRVSITNRKTAQGNPIIFLKKGYTRATTLNEQRFAAEYIAIGKQKGYSNLIPHLNPDESTTITLSFAKVPSHVTQLSSLSVHYREDNGSSPYVGNYLAAVFQRIPILEPL